MTRRNGNTFVSRNVIKSGAKKSKQFSKWILNDENKENDVFSVTDTGDSKKKWITSSSNRSLNQELLVAHANVLLLS